MRCDDVNQAIEWAKALPVLGDSPKAKLLAEEVERLRDEMLETRRSVMSSVMKIARDVRK